MNLTQLKSPYSEQPLFDQRQIGLLGLSVGAIFAFPAIYVGLSLCGVEDRQAFLSALIVSITIIFSGQLFVLVSDIKRVPTEAEESVEADKEYDLEELEDLHQHAVRVLKECVTEEKRAKAIRAEALKIRTECISMIRLFQKQRLHQNAQRCRDIQKRAEDLLRSNRVTSSKLDKLHVEIVQLKHTIENKATVAETMLLLRSVVEPAIGEINDTLNEEDVLYQHLAQDLSLASA